MDIAIKNSENCTKDIILNITVGLINNCEISKITVRNVARLAGVNIAAINYHFGTKENLLDEALKKILSPVWDIEKILDEDIQDPRAKLKKLLTTLACFIKSSSAPFRYFIATKNVISGEQYGTMKFIKDKLFIKLTNLISLVTGEKDLEKLTILAMQINSAIILPNLAVSKDSPFGMDLPDVETQIDIFLEHLK